MATLSLPAGPDRSDFYFKIALGISIAAHAVLLSVKFVYPELKKLSSTTPLDVILVNSKTQSSPLNPQALAQANLDGGGNTDQNRRIKTPLPLQKDADTAQEQQVEQAMQRQQQLESEAQKLMTMINTKRSVSEPDKRTRAEQQQASGKDAKDEEARNLAMARLEGQISKDWDAYQNRPRKKFIGARTTEFRFARYVEDWRQKVERIGTNLYPVEAKQKGIHGRLQMTVEIKADGTVASVEVNRSSGHKILDEAAKRIVFQSAPFAPFPPDVRKDSDIISITRTWTFTTANKLESGD
ncbi:protein TonB [Chitinivorax tropicus]|uniref:Protein TonB n=1 Tax=Chitinivorax tropicus TaxID=714531 RepID=A0A840MPF0_9PROT|nr:protein TonB [Chitinivorax tropicus]